MRTLLAASLLLLPVSAASAPAPAGDMRVIEPFPVESVECPPISRFHMTKRNGKAKSRKLTELPPGDAYLAVERRIGQCQVPIIVRYGIGGRQR